MLVLTKIPFKGKIILGKQKNGHRDNVTMNRLGTI